jgi:hypothetical protein
MVRRLKWPDIKNYGDLNNEVAKRKSSLFTQNILLVISNQSSPIAGGYIDSSNAFKRRTGHFFNPMYAIFHRYIPQKFKVSPRGSKFKVSPREASLRCHLVTFRHLGSNNPYKIIFGKTDIRDFIFSKYPIHG